MFKLTTSSKSYAERFINQVSSIDWKTKFSLASVNLLAASTSPICSPVLQLQCTFAEDSEENEKKDNLIASVNRICKDFGTDVRVMCAKYKIKVSSNK